MAYGSDMATTHNTVTVELRLDLGETIVQLRNLADALEATQKPKPAEDTGECKHEAWEREPNAITRRCADCRAVLPEVTR